MSNQKQNVLTFAKQGNTKAITLLINKALSTQGISVADIQISDGLLVIKLQASNSPIDENLLSKIKSSAEKLDINLVEEVSVTEVFATNTLKREANTGQINRARKREDSQKTSHAVSKKTAFTSKAATTSINDKKLNLNFLNILSHKRFFIVGSSSGIVLCSIVALLFMGLGSGSRCKVDGQPAYKLFQSYEDRWSDAVALANNTSRMALAQPISDMQSIKRDVENTSWEKCSQPAANLLTQAMEKKIDGFILFLDSDSPESSIQNDFESSSTLMFDYHKKYLSLLPRRERIEQENKDTEFKARSVLSSMNVHQLSRHTEHLITMGDRRPLIQSIEEFDKERTEHGMDSITHVSEDNVYDFTITEASDAKFIAIASANKKDLRSYVTGIFSTKNDYKMILCESDKPSKDIEPPTLYENTWSCAGESTELESLGT